MSTSLPDLRAFRAFVAVVEHGGVSAAARALGEPKSSVSRALAAVEAEVGQRLVQRTTRSFRPTDAGAALAARLRVALDEVADALAESRGAATAPRGTLRVTMPTLIAATVARAALPAFVARYPEVRVSLLATNRWVDLAAEAVDSAVRVGSPPESSTPVLRVGEIETALVASPAYLRAAGPVRRASDLARHSCLAFSLDESTPVRWPLGDVALTVRGAVATDDFTVLRELALAGLGVAWLPRFLVEDALRSGALRAVLPGTPLAGPPVWIATPAGRRASAATRAWVDHLRAELPGALGVRPPGAPGPRATADSTPAGTRGRRARGGGR